jgi:hypothetical protein
VRPVRRGRPRGLHARRDPAARLGRIHLADHAAAPRARLRRRSSLAAGTAARSDQQLVEHHAQRIHVRCACRSRLGVPCPPARAACTRACRWQAALLGCAPRLPSSMSSDPSRLRQAEVQDLRNRCCSPSRRDQHVAGLEVAVDHAPLVRVLDAFAQTCLDQPDALRVSVRAGSLIAVRRSEEGPSIELHHEVRLAPYSVVARVEHLGDRKGGSSPPARCRSRAKRSSTSRESLRRACARS